jgi:hypothetical protein
MENKNLDAIVRAICSCRVSEQFTLGVLFMLGGTLMRAAPGSSPEEVSRSLQWVMPHDINEVADDILSRMYDGKLQSVLEELFFKLNIQIPLRDMRIGELSSQLLTPADHGLLKSPPLTEIKMSALSSLYFSAIEQIGSILAESEYSTEEAYLAGICFFSMWARIDTRATASVLNELAEWAPPVLKFFFSVPRFGGIDLNAWLPVQFALWGFVNGVEDEFVQIIWRYQSRLLFEDGRPVLGVDDLSSDDFFVQCHSIAKNFFLQNKEKIQRISKLEVGPYDIPLFTGSADERDAIYKVMKSIWGYATDDPQLAHIEKLQVKACLIFLIFCSVCRSSREQVEFLGQMLSEKENKILILDPCAPVNSLDEFVHVAEHGIRGYQRFSLCAAFSDRSRKQFRFFVSEEILDAPAMRALLVNLIVATKSSQIFVMYFADVARLLNQDLGQFQSILFRVDANGSAPYWFCRMHALPDRWTIEPFSSLSEEDPQGILFLSDLVQEFHERLTDEILDARTQLEAWQPKADWNWQEFDR